jgi:hypothetical protein
MYFLATVNAKWPDIVNTFTITIQNNLTDIIFATAPCKMSQLTCNHCYYNVGTCICSVLLLDQLCTYLSLWYSDVVSVLMWFPERQVWRSRIDLDVCDDKFSTSKHWQRLNTTKINMYIIGPKAERYIYMYLHCSNNDYM